MNEIISKWNKEIISIEKTGESVDTRQYIRDKNIKIVDLKYLKQINKYNLLKELNIIMEEVNKELYDSRDTMCIDPEDKLNICNDYCRCLLCILNHLIDIKRLKIMIEGEYM